MDSNKIISLISKFSKSLITFILGLISAYIGGVFYGEIGFLVGIIAFMVAVIVGINTKEIWSH